MRTCRYNMTDPMKRPGSRPAWVLTTDGCLMMCPVKMAGLGGADAARSITHRLATAHETDSRNDGRSTREVDILFRTWL